MVKDAALAQEALAEALVQLREEKKGVPDLVHCPAGGELLGLLIALDVLEDEGLPQLRHGALCLGEALAAVLGEPGQEPAPSRSKLVACVLILMDLRHWAANESNLTPVNAV